MAKWWRHCRVSMRSMAVSTPWFTCRHPCCDLCPQRRHLR
jgi:hypothetical protein